METKFWNKTTLYSHIDSLKTQLGVPFAQYPIDSQSLAYKCIRNLFIDYIPFPSTKICGILYKGNTSTSIALNANRTVQMQNFDCMHELIHYFLHNVSYCQCICCDEQGSKYIQQDRIQEWQANEGAAQFLVPDQDFIPHFSARLDEQGTSWSIQSELASYYGVSTQVINIRIESLSYEISQYRNGVPIEKVELLSRNQRRARGIKATNYSALCDFALEWDSVIV